MKKPKGWRWDGKCRAGHRDRQVLPMGFAPDVKPCDYLMRDEKGALTGETCGADMLWEYVDIPGRSIYRVPAS